MGERNPTTAGASADTEALTRPQFESIQTQSDPSTSISSPSPNPSAVLTPPPPSSIVTPPSQPIHPSLIPPGTPQFFPAAGYSTMPPGVVGPPQPQPYGIAGQAVRYVAPPMPNGYPLGAVPPPGVPRYPNPYAPMIRPGFPPRPMVGVMPPLARPPIISIRGPLISPVVRPHTVASASPAEEPQKTVYVGKLLPTVENDFMLSLLQLCGPVKSWKRPHGTTGALRGFGFCEFESAEGVLRALRLLNKLSVDGQELMLNVGDETKEYLKRYVEKRIESTQIGEGLKAEGQKEDSSAPGADGNKEPSKASSDELEKGEDQVDNKNPDAANFGIVTDEDREADHEALEKITNMIEERLKNKPIPPPPPPRDLGVSSSNINSEHSGSRDRGAENVAKNEDQSEDEKNAESKQPNEPGKPETDSPDMSKRRERSRDRDRDVRRDKERELERYEREREQERAKREKDREYKSREDERRYKTREKEWEARERERDHWRKKERERERERAQERKWEVMDQERGDDDGYGKKRKYRTSDEERRRRQRERDDDWADRLREEEEIVEAKEREGEDRQRKEAEALKLATEQQVANGPEPQQDHKENEEMEDQTASDGVQQNGTADESAALSNASLDVRQNNAPTSRKLGFGLSGSGKRASVPSVFNTDEDEDAHKEKKMRPLVPIDYTSEEQQGVPSISEDPYATTVDAAAAFAKRSSTIGSKEEKLDAEKDKSRRSHERSSHRDRDRHEDETRANRTKTPENQKPLAKQLIDTIPKTKDDLFSYKINWSIYDQNELHEQLRPWVSKKITDYLGEEEVTLVDYIVSSTQEHVEAAEMLERLQTILDDEAEMFVLKMWRMLIFEIKKVENGLAVKSRS